MGLGEYAEKQYAAKMLVRYDEDPGVKHFGVEDFEGLKREEYSFVSGENRLAAWFYYYPAPRKDALVVFEHGLGNGHTAYLREIELLAKRGFLVFTYDHTGCMRSEGESVQGFARSPMDLDNALRAVEAEEALRGRKILVVGHSWGGFATLNVGAMHPEVTAAVAISGFRSARAMLAQSVPFFARFLVSRIMKIEEKNNGKYAHLNAVESLKKGGVPTLVIHGDRDPVVHFGRHFLPIERAKLPNVRLLPVSGRGHSPHYAPEAEEYMTEFFRERARRAAAGGLTGEELVAFADSFDFWRMTEQDPEVWKEIISFLEEKTGDAS